MDYSNKLSIQQELKQYLRLTPEMRLRLDVLQATSLELKEILSNELEENPIIEDIIYPEDDVEPSGEKQDKEEETEEIKINDSKPHLEEINSDEYDNVFPKDDFENKNNYEEEYNPEFAKIRDRRYNNTPSEEKKDLQSELKKQLDGLDITREDYAAAEILVSNIDSDGFLTEDISAISLASNVQEETLNKMLEVIKTFEPAGVGARNVSESLMIQLRQKNQKDSLAYQIVEKYFDLLSKKEYKKLARIFKVSEQDIKKAEEIMKELSPYPGRNLTKYANEYIVPDIIVIEEDGIYKINMAGDIPEIKINKDYLKMYKEKKETKEFIRKYEARIKAILSSIEERNKTTVKVVGKILEVQRDFLSNEMTGLKPLTLKEIAEAVGVHESTISRIVSRKYIQMPSGVFPLKKFFSGKLDTTEGEVSSSSIKEKITAMVENEDKKNPLTDMEIADILVKQGVNIARRTIAKYRELADIPAAGIRKRLSIKD